MRGTKQRDNEFDELLAKTAYSLPASVRQELLAQGPDALRSVLAAAAAASSLTKDAADVESIGSHESPALIDPGEAKARIRDRAVPAEQQEFLSSDEMAKHIGITRTTVHEWVKAGKLIGWQGAKRGHRFPAAQLDKHGQPPIGLERITAILGNERATWDWLTSELTLLDGDTPLVRLRAGDIDEVEGAAQAHYEGVFV